VSGTTRLIGHKMAAKKATKKTTTRRSTRTIKTAAQVASDVLDAQPEDENTKKVRAARQSSAVAASAELSVEKVTQSLTKAGLDINKTLNGVKEIFESEISSLETLKEAIVAKEDELSELHDKEVIANSLRDLVLQHNAKKAAFEDEAAATKKSWEKEQVEHEEFVTQRDSDFKKRIDREEEEYEFKKAIRIRNDDEAYKLKVTTRENDRKQTENTLTKQWEEREAALKAAEALVAESKDKLDNFDSIVEEEVNKKVHTIGSRMKAEYENKARISALENDSEKKLLQRDNTSLKDQLAAKSEEIATLRDTIAKLNSEVKEVAVAAMEAQSGQKALNAVQQTVQSQGSSKK